MARAHRPAPTLWNPRRPSQWTSALPQPGVDPAKCGKLGGGPMIGMAPILNRPMTNRLLELAKSTRSPTPWRSWAGETGTNADEIAVSRTGVPTAMVSIPLRYMHTPVEVIDTQDVAYTARLLAEYVKGVD